MNAVHDAPRSNHVKRKDDYEELEGALDPHRADERRGAVQETIARLRTRGISVGSDENADHLVGLLEAVERFEAAVERHGGDLMVDDLKSSEPDDRHYVVPQRRPGETVPDYALRIDEATAHLRRHPRRPD
jgi:hypothetical protein